MRSDLRADHAEPQLRIRRGKLQEHLGIFPALAARDPDGVVVLFARLPYFTEVQAFLEDGHPRVGPLSEDIVALKLVLRHDEVREPKQKEKERAPFMILLVFPLALDIVRQHEDEAHAENARVQREKARLDRETALKNDIGPEPSQGAVIDTDLFHDGIAFLEGGNKLEPVCVVEIDDRVIGDERKGLNARPAEELARDHEHLHVRPAESAAGGPVKEGFGVLGEDDGDFHRSLLNT